MTGRWSPQTRRTDVDSVGEQWRRMRGPGGCAARWHVTQRFARVVGGIWKVSIPVLFLSFFLVNFLNSLLNKCCRGESPSSLVKKNTLASEAGIQASLEKNKLCTQKM